MKRFNHHKLAILPLLGILAMSPSVLTSKHAARGIASVEDGKPEVKREVKREVKEEKKEEAKKEDIVKKEESKTPKYDALVSKTDPKSIMKDIDNSLEKFSKKRDELTAKILKEREDFKKDQSDKAVVEAQRTKIESLVIEVLLVEGSLKDLEEKKAIEQADDDSSKKLLGTSKDVVESLLNDLDVNEKLVAKASEPKVEEPKKEEPKVAEEKKEEVKKEEVKKEEVKVADDKKEEKKDEVKKEEKSDSEKLLCEVQEQNKILSKQVEQLINDQKQLMNTFMGMAQMMVGMYQQQQANQHNPYYQNGPGFNSSPYQYNAPMSAGNWVYYPQGFQPQQQNIFAQPQPQMGGYYPDQMHMQQQQGQPQMGGQWGLQPQMNFGMQQQQIPSYGDQRYQQYPQFTPGSFGDSQFSFNLQNPTPSPMLSMR